MAASTTASAPAAPARPLGAGAASGPFAQAWRRLLRKRAARYCLILLIAYVLLAVAAPILPIHGPSTMDQDAELAPPSSTYLLGTDQFGRDILSRAIYGARVSLMVSIVAVVLGTLVGVSTGLIAGFHGGIISAVLLRIYDALLAFPAILLAIGIAATTGPGVLNASLALAIVSAPQFARVARAGVLVEKNKEYVQAANCLGVSGRRILFRHILPNVTGPILVQITLFTAFAVLLESALSFLGLGVQPPQPSLGSMLAEGRPYLREAPWYGLVPGVALTVLIFSLNTLSDSVRDVLDPRLTRSS
jgi:peptide/nickel transport system permease protein